MSEEKDSARSAGVPKAAMRARMRETLGTLAHARFIEGGAAISRRVLEEVGHARVVMAFVPMRRGGKLMEADITGVLDGVVAAGKRLALARATGDGGVEACEVGEDWRGEVVESALKGVMEPAASARRVAAAEIDVVIVPGLAFDAMGGRLGRGKGFYDRFLGEMKLGSPESGADTEPPLGEQGYPRQRHPARSAGLPNLIGVCLEEQVVGEVPREGHDVLVGCVVTDVRTMRVAGLET